MADEVNGFKEFVRSEIRTVKDAAARNYEEHQTLYAGLAAIDKRLAVMEERLVANAEVRKARLGAVAAVAGPTILALGALAVSLLK